MKGLDVVVGDVRSCRLLVEKKEWVRRKDGLEWPG